MVWKSSSSLSSSRSSHMVRVHLECGCCTKSMGFCKGTVLEGDELSTVEVSSSSSEELKVRWCHTGLLCDLLVCVLCGVTGLKEMFSSLETWQILEVLLRGVGILKFSLPLSYPSSSNVSLLSNAALNVVMKQSNKTSSDWWHSKCVDVEWKKMLYTCSMALLRTWASRSVVQNCKAATVAFHNVM